MVEIGLRARRRARTASTRARAAENGGERGPRGVGRPVASRVGKMGRLCRPARPPTPPPALLAATSRISMAGRVHRGVGDGKRVGFLGRSRRTRTRPSARVSVCFFPATHLPALTAALPHPSPFQTNTVTPSTSTPPRCAWTCRTSSTLTRTWGPPWKTRRPRFCRCSKTRRQPMCSTRPRANPGAGTRRRRRMCR